MYPTRLRRLSTDDGKEFADVTMAATVGHSAGKHLFQPSV